MPRVSFETDGRKGEPGRTFSKDTSIKVYDKESGLDEWESSSSEASIREVDEGDRFSDDEVSEEFIGPKYFHEPEGSGPITYSRKLARYLSQASYLIFAACTILPKSFELTESTCNYNF